MQADCQLQHEVEQFLYEEADILDQRDFHKWLTLLAEGIDYWMPIRTTRAKGDEENEFAQRGQGAFFDENRQLLEERVRKLDTGFSWAEDPPSRTRHIVSNVRIVEQTGSDLKVECNFMLYRSRLANTEDLWVGRREDTLKRVNGCFKLAGRHIFLDQVALGSKNLSVFF
jgi:3-phenylpropionate/cinnamic acid dioxygenase small subunit